MAYTGTVTITDITDTSARVVVTDIDAPTSDYTIAFTLSAAGTTVASPSVIIPAGELSGSTVLESLTPNTEYTLQATAAISPGPRTSSFVTKATGYNDPKTATQEQWEDLADRVNAKATITMTTTDPGEGSTLAANNFVGVYGGDPIIMDYSTSEVNTGVKWIDGSTIYTKTITYSIAATGDNTAAHGITNLGHVVKLEGVLVSSSGDSKSLNYNDMNNAAVTYLHSTSVRTYAVGSDVVGRTAYVTIYYTKSS